jgi:hypothetical protein
LKKKRAVFYFIGMLIILLAITETFSEFCIGKGKGKVRPIRVHEYMWGGGGMWRCKFSFTTETMERGWAVNAEPLEGDPCLGGPLDLFVRMWE